MFKRWTEDNSQKSKPTIIQQARKLIDESVNLEDNLTTEAPRRSKGRVIETSGIKESNEPSPASKIYMKEHFFGPKPMSSSSTPVDYAGYQSHIERLREEANKDN
jgi:hypothetical protein